MSHCFLYQHGGHIDLGTLGGPQCWVQAMNAFGHVIGSSSTLTGESHPFIYARGQMTDLTPVVGDFNGTAINDRDEMAGSVEFRAAVFSKGRVIDLDAAIRALGTGGVLESEAFDINNSGEVVGWYTIDNGGDPEQPWLWRAFVGTPISLLLDRLRHDSKQINFRSGLPEKVRMARVAYGEEDKDATCSALNAFIDEARALRGRLPEQLADALIADGQEIAGAVACEVAQPGETTD
jgi:probable HAF family extracellular repeat protein